MDEGTRDYHGVRMSFMIADSDAELHAMAAVLGLKREPFARGRTHAYYIPETIRDRAVSRGAKLIERRQLLEMARRQR